VYRGLLVAGTTSDAGKSLVTAGLCRWLAREGVRVAPFKSQNMSNNSMVCPDGTEIGRAQWLQAVAARATPEAAMNPVLLKPGSDLRSHVVLMGKPHGQLEAGEWATNRRVLAERSFEAYRDLAGRYDVVIAEGAGSPAEVNLRDGDYVNLGLARAVGLPVVVVGDIDRGGVLAAMYGTLGLLDPADQAQIRGWIVNKFRGDLDLLRPGLSTLEERTSRPVLGVLPFLYDVWLDGEDALAVAGWSGAASAEESETAAETRRGSTMSVAVVRFPRISNTTDVDALAAEPGVDVRVTADADAVARADLVVLPGSRATVSDLSWLRSRGLDRALTQRVVDGRPVLGICGGYQMLARTIDDRDGVESAAGGCVPGLGLLPTTVRFETAKTLGTPTGHWRRTHVTAYEIHHATARLDPDVAARDSAGESREPFLDGWRVGSAWGTTWHGTLENDAFRRAFLVAAGSQAGLDWRPADGAPGFAQRREAMLDRLADAVEEHLDTGALLRLVGLEP
jgi:adenosylcobyric acid synthase